MVAAGLVPILAALDILPSAESSFHAPRWVVAVAGLAFVFAGLSLMVQGLRARLGDGGQRPAPAADALLHLIGLSALGCLVAVFNWVAFGAGERQCTGGLSLSFIAISGRASAAACRAVFALGAMVGNFIFAWGCWHALRQGLRGGRETRR